MTNHFSIQFIVHKELTNNMLDRIVHLKQQCWSYPVESQIRWIMENIRDDEFHLCLENQHGSLIGYLNLINLIINFNNELKKVLGVGNVCVCKANRNKGIGKLLMTICNYYIQEQNKSSILLCKSELCDFYQQTGWVEFAGFVFLKELNYTRSIMVKELEHTGIMKIDREF